MPFVYVLFSEKLNRYYIGSTQLNPEIRLDQHNTKHQPGSFTCKGIPWSLVLSFSVATMHEAMSIERHCKGMKSRSYLENLLKYPEMLERLKSRYTHSPQPGSSV